MADGSPTHPLESFIRRMAEYMRIECSVRIDANMNHPQQPIAIGISVADDARFLIGKNGQNLKALEHIIRLASLRQNPTQLVTSVDVNDYRKIQTNELVQRIHEVAVRVRNTRKPEALDPMAAYERRVVHTELATYHDLATESVGQEPQRRVVIKPL